MLTEASLRKMGRLISARMGWRIHDHNVERLRKTLLERMRCLKLSSPEAYFHLLEFDTGKGLNEWETLIPCVANGETYFFRDKGQWLLLEKTILPELIKRRTAQRCLRIWSAGCAPGEEAYSLAITVNELLPSRRNWKVRIWGTDINRKAIDYARQGSYRQWSFRMVDSDLQQRYFVKQAETWDLKDHIRQMVTFHSVNLLKDAFPSQASGLYDIDLILCRNVFLHFEPEATAHVAQKMMRVLTPGGYLMTGHHELSPKTLGRLHVRVFPTGIIHQLPEKVQAPVGL